VAKRVPIAKFIATSGMSQTALAAAVGVTQGAINQMLRSERSIFVITNDDGSLRLEEIKPLGKAATA
jgi:predicted transcriptional regulator